MLGAANCTEAVTQARQLSLSPASSALYPDSTVVARAGSVALSCRGALRKITRKKNMTTKDTDDRTAEAIDFTMMYVTHDAFRRDQGPLHDGIGRRAPSCPGGHAGWENFKAQLLLHRSVEDTHLWPRVRRAAAGRPAGVALLDEMEAEHAQIDRCSPWSTEIAASLHLSLPPSRRTSAASWPS